ncbi:hypothetical protein RchiOBHm_Chr2g0130351 [Rosa chinensis]|uniref:COBRA C-terminal domain-containing protein n=1 Tax=Rosa chinensis TaxID=74649 RepID=A0A2P6RUS9_ROSCH|nr:hypothetical protein RchiOBHm_Chr2g0130351 [Rosa chinensis]
MVKVHEANSTLGQERSRSCGLDWTCTPNRLLSLGAFYDNKIVGCPKCACGCHTAKVGSCVDSNCPYSRLALEESSSSPLIQCSNDMCPVCVHCHIKQNYRDYWRVKFIVTNFNLKRNYCEWNVVV